MRSWEFKGYKQALPAVRFELRQEEGWGRTSTKNELLNPLKTSPWLCCS